MKSAIIKSVWLILLVAAAALAGCNAYKKQNIALPVALEKHFIPTVQVHQLWKISLGSGAGNSGVRLRPEVVDGVLYAASSAGKLAAFDARHGKMLWQVTPRLKGWANKQQDTHYTGGPAIVGDLLAIGTLDGHVYAVNAKNGSLRWKTQLSAEVISAPAIDGEWVIVRCEDGRVYGLDRSTGERRWVYDQGNVPPLSLRGTGPLLVANGVVFFGSDDGKLIALREDNGEKLWEQLFANGEGRTEIDRLSDADGAILLQGNTLYGAAYHGNLLAVDGPSGRPLWTRPFSTFTSLAIHAQSIYGVDDQSRVWAFDTNGGADIWKNDKLRYRWLTAPAVQGDYVVVGDMDGYVHWLQSSDGALAARARLSKQPIRAQPVVADNIVYIEDIAGHMAAYRLGK